MARYKFTREEAKAHIDDLTLSDNLIFVDIWTPDDIRAQAVNTNVITDDEEMTDDDIRKIFYIIQNTFDANIGVNWEVIDCAINELKKNPELYKEI